VYLAKARKNDAGAEALKAIETYFADMGKEIRRVEQARLNAEPSHLRDLLEFAGRAYRRPLTLKELAELPAFYHKLRKEEGLGHEEALGDTIVSILMSPHFCFRVDVSPVGPASRAEPEKTGDSKSNQEPKALQVPLGKRDLQPLSDYALASRLSYFLWASMPDGELLDRAATGDLHKPEVLIAQTRRLLRDPRVRGLATEFAGNWLDFRRFEEHNSVDRERFPTFTNELRQAMFEEPVRYFIDMAQRNRSVLDLLYGQDTFVNQPLAQHYGMPFPVKSAKARGTDQWIHIEDARPYGRGGVLPMAVFLTKNAPGLRTSPVKRGYWVVRGVLGGQIPPPPPDVPELPRDEANLGELSLPQLLARHRDNKSCAGCHNRFDAIGLVFEDFGPIGERRTKDLGGRPTQTRATFPDGQERQGLEGLRAYLREKRQGEFVDNMCKKLLTYALGRSLMVSDQKTLDALRARLVADDYKFGGLVEEIVKSSQFLNRRAAGETRKE